MDGARPPDLHLYAMKKTLSVLIGGHGVRVVAEAHEHVGALLISAKYRRKRGEGLFSNIVRRKKRAKFKNICVKLVTSFLLKRPVEAGATIYTAILNYP